MPAALGFGERLEAHPGLQEGCVVRIRQWRRGQAHGGGAYARATLRIDADGARALDVDTDDALRAIPISARPEA